MQEEWSKRDADTMLSTRQSYSQREKQRTTLYFETMEEAAVRVGKRKRQEDLGVSKKKRLSPPPHQVDFDKENLLENQGVDLKRFQQLRRGDQSLPRRRLNRMVGGDITVPLDESCPPQLILFSFRFFSFFFLLFVLFSVISEL